MSDWADEKALTVMDQITPHVGMHPNVQQISQAAISQALRDVQRETAEECRDIARDVRAPIASAAIRERFGLED